MLKLLIEIGRTGLDAALKVDHLDRQELGREKKYVDLQLHLQ